MRKEYNNCDSFQNVSNCSNIRPWTGSWTDLAIPFEFWRYVRIPPAHLLKKESKQDSKGTNSFQNVRLGVMLHCLVQQRNVFHAFSRLYSYAWLSNLFIGWPCLTFTRGQAHTYRDKAISVPHIWIHLDTSGMCQSSLKLQSANVVALENLLKNWRIDATDCYWTRCNIRLFKFLLVAVTLGAGAKLTGDVYKEYEVHTHTHIRAPDPALPTCAQKSHAMPNPVVRPKLRCDLVVVFVGGGVWWQIPGAAISILLARLLACLLACV